MLTRFLNDNKLIRKNAESSMRAVYKKALIKIGILLMSAKLLINSKATYQANINKYVDISSPWRELFSKLK